MEMVAVILEIFDFTLDQLAEHPAQVAHRLGQAFQSLQHFGLLAVAQLVQKGWTQALVCSDCG